MTVRERVTDWLILRALRLGLRPLAKRRTFRCPCCGYKAVSTAQILFTRRKG